MKHISIVYYSGSGHTAAMAQAVQRGAESVADVQVSLQPIRGSDIAEGRYQNADTLAALTASDAIIFGSPTYMGGPAAQFKAFADATGGIWYQRQWLNKVAAGFTHSGSPSGDKLSTLQYFSVLAAQHGMIWVGNSAMTSTAVDQERVNRVGAFLGAMGYGSAAGDDSQVAPGDLQTAEFLGARVATLVLQHSPALVAA